MPVELRPVGSVRLRDKDLDHLSRRWRHRSAFGDAIPTPLAKAKRRGHDPNGRADGQSCPCRNPGKGRVLTFDLRRPQRVACTAANVTRERGRADMSKRMPKTDTPPPLRL